MPANKPVMPNYVQRTNEMRRLSDLMPGKDVWSDNVDAASLSEDDINQILKSAPFEMSSDFLDAVKYERELRKKQNASLPYGQLLHPTYTRSAYGD